MNTPTTPQSPLLHESRRTSISSNKDAATGRQVRVMTNSRLVMQMRGGELVIWFEASRIELRAEARDLRPVRRIRDRL